MIVARHESILRQTRSQDGSMDNVKGVSGDANEGGNLSPQDEAIIGGVVGGIAFIASELTLFAYLMSMKPLLTFNLSVTAGIITLIFKKRKWDRIRRREEALLALHAPPAYHSSSDNNNTTTTDNDNRWTSTSLPGR